MNSGFGPVPARIMLVGESYGREEKKAGRPFVGMSGIELDRMLNEARIVRADCFISNLVNDQPPKDMTDWVPLRKKDITPDCVRLRDRMVKPIVVQGLKNLVKEIELVKPMMIITFGGYSTWALTGQWPITKWRGSQLDIQLEEIQQWLL